MQITAGPCWSSEFSVQDYSERDGVTENVPDTLSSSDSKPLQNLSKLFKGKNAKQVQDCTRQCVQSCVRTGSAAGAVFHAGLFENAALCGIPAATWLNTLCTNKYSQALLLQNLHRVLDCSCDFQHSFSSRMTIDGMQGQSDLGPGSTRTTRHSKETAITTGSTACGGVPPPAESSRKHQHRQPSRQRTLALRIIHRRVLYSTVGRLQVAITSCGVA